jgi:hypothetical protein
MVVFVRCVRQKLCVREEKMELKDLYIPPMSRLHAEIIGISGRVLARFLRIGQANSARLTEAGI